MTLIELLVFLFIFGGSAYAGHQIGMLVAPSNVGAWTAAGPITAVIVMFMIGFVGRRFNDEPKCECGRSGGLEGWRVHPDPNWSFTIHCPCGRRYVQRKGLLFFEVISEDTAILVAVKNFWGRWRPPTEQQTANNTLVPTVAKRSGGTV